MALQQRWRFQASIADAQKLIEESKVCKGFLCQKSMIFVVKSMVVWLVGWLASKLWLLAIDQDEIIF